MLETPTFAVNSLAFAPDGKTLAVADGSLKLLSVETGKEVRALLQSKFPPDPNNISIGRISFSPDGKQIASPIAVKVLEQKPSTVRVWQVGGFWDARNLTGRWGMVIDAVFFPDSQTLAASYADSTIVIWDVKR